jgi:Tetratricopeptide repeat
MSSTDTNLDAAPQSQDQETNDTEKALSSFHAPSVHYLQTTFLEEVLAAGYSKSSTINDIENLRDSKPGVIRRKGLEVICLNDSQKGAAYVDCLAGEDNVGYATHMLSYSWGYTVGDIVDTLVDFCATNDLNPKRTYIWICCLCVNQHRVVGATLDTSGFVQVFGKRVQQIGHILCIMAPWQSPQYLTRVWCIFELYTTNQCGCKVSIVMPPEQNLLLEKELLGDHYNCVEIMFKALSNTKVQNAVASLEHDQKTILGIIGSSTGYEVLNRKVNDLLRAWIQAAIALSVNKREDTNDISFVSFCSKLGALFFSSGDHCRAFEKYQRCLVIQESVLDKNHPYTATTYNNIGLVLQNKGDYEGSH